MHKKCWIHEGTETGCTYYPLSVCTARHLNVFKVRSYYCLRATSSEVRKIELCEQIIDFKGYKSYNQE